MSKLRWLLAVLIAVAVAPFTALAQEPATITGRVTGPEGEAVPAALVRIEALGVGATSTNDGSYRLVVPAARVRTGQQVQISASRVGFATQTRTITLSPGASLTQSFQLTSDVLLLDEVVATGQGTTRQRAALGATVNTVRAEEIVQSNETNVVAALAGKAPNVQVTKSGGDPGSGAYFRIRGANSVFGGTQPLIVVDGIPIDNSSDNTEAGTEGTTVSNRAADINPNDIESIEILKGPAAAALYGSRGSSGVVLITTKRGRPGENNVSYSVSLQRDEVSDNAPLQQRFGQGQSALIDGRWGDYAPTSTVSWGLPIACVPNCEEGEDVFDHGEEIFRTGTLVDQNLTLSGGSDLTTYLLSLGWNDHEGVVNGNSDYGRRTVRLKATHSFSDQLTIGGNFNYIDASGNLVQQGSNISGLLLGALRTPPDFNNMPYLTDTTFAVPGLHRSYRVPNPTSLASTRGYDNPFFTIREQTNTENVNRFIGNVDLAYRPTDWLSVNYLGGVDYGSNTKLNVLPKSSSSVPTGRAIRGEFINTILDSNLTLTLNRALNDNIQSTWTFGHNLNQTDFRQNQVNGTNLITGTDKLQFTVTRVPSEQEARVRTEGLFGQSTFEFFDQFFLTGALRWEGSSGFGKRTLYPKLESSWVFSETFRDQLGFLDLGRVRFSYGVAGKQPPVYSNVSSYNTGLIFDSFVFTPAGLETIYLGQEGVQTQGVLGNPEIKPERTAGWDLGGELAFLGSRVTLGVTYYNERTSDVILAVPIASSTGFNNKWDNVGEIENNGFEVTLGLRPLDTRNIAWNVDAQWATNNSCVRDLGGAEFISLGGFTGALTGLYRPDTTASGAITNCYEFNTFYAGDFVRFGNGTLLDEYDAYGRLVAEGVDIDEAYSGWEEGDLYLGADGLPLADEQQRALGNMNPDWTGSLRNTFTLFNKLRLSGLLDFSYGGKRWNGTAGALTYFGTHERTNGVQGAGRDTIFEGAGPGAGQRVIVNWDTWVLGNGNSFGGPDSQDYVDASWAKLRDITLSYAFGENELNRFGFTRLGFSGLALTLSGRNLATWTDYVGIDPESNLTGQTAARGLDYFHNPQTRSFAISLTLTR